MSLRKLAGFAVPKSAPVALIASAIRSLVTRPSGSPPFSYCSKRCSMTGGFSDSFFGSICDKHNSLWDFRLRDFHFGTMVDNRSPESRSALMSRIGGKDTAPEMVVRILLHGLGYRFRLHRRDLPGTPDIVFPSRRKVILVNGCFWHSHGCSIGRPPKSRPEFWLPKLQRNRSNDARNRRLLRNLGWGVLAVWQCQTKSRGRLEARLISFLGPPGKIPIDKSLTTR